MRGETLTSWLAGEWSSHIGPAIESMTGEAAAARRVDGEGSEPGAQDALIWRQPVAIGRDAEIWAVASPELWKLVGELVLKAAGLENGEPSEIRGTFQEVLQQSLSPLSFPLGTKLQREVELLPGATAERFPAALDWQCLEVELGGRTAGRAWISCNESLLIALDPPRTALVAAEGAAPPAKPSKTMDLLMEVELPVGVSFGRAQMKLKDAIKLTTGSIVELNRSISEPVEVIVNNCVIARGEVVVVEGNYGVRIKQIVSREERLRTLF